MGGPWQPARTISDGGTTYHYQDWRIKGGGERRKVLQGIGLKPVCRVANWEDKTWFYDDGLGADLCGRCDRLRQRELEVRAETKRRLNREHYWRNREKIQAQQAEYRKQTVKQRRIKRKKLEAKKSQGRA